MGKPILVLQMQRMGDLILTFPLLSMLYKRYPDNPVWTVAEPQFFKDLMPLAPYTTFFPPQAAKDLASREYLSVINLSHRRSAALLAGSVDSEQYFGAYIRDGVHRIAGSWALYRASIVQNNRYNLFHWSDLQILDHSPASASQIFPMQGKDVCFSMGEKVGIFVGASEVEKRPSPAFYAQIAVLLMRKGLRPVFFGGPDDVALGLEAERLAGIHGTSMCGKMSLTQLATVMRDLSLLITADTGPMHLAAWLRVPILNISLGPVNPWETGPSFSGHYVVQAARSCAGCWQACEKPERCRGKLSAQRIALFAHTLLKRSESLSRLRMSGHRVFATGRDGRGLYTLLPQNCDTRPSVRHLLAEFWRDWFWFRLHDGGAVPCESVRVLYECAPRVMEKFQMAVLRWGRNVRGHIVQMRKGGERALPASFWQDIPNFLRPFSGYIDIFLQNELHSHEAWEKVLYEMELLVTTLRP